MSTRTLALTVLLVTAAGSVFAQAPPAAPQPGQAPRARGGTAPPAEPRSATPPAAATVPSAPARPRREGQPVNIKVEFTLTDQRADGPAIKRTISVVVADGRTGQIRSQSEVVGIGGPVPLNVDTAPELLADNKIRLGFSLQYDWPAPFEAGDRPPARGTVMKTSMHDSVSLILESGKSMVAAQSADPIGDRQVTVEVKATILR